MSLAQSITLNSGHSMPLLGLGTWKSSNDDVYKAVKVAIENGYRHIDCAMVYENECAVGKALAEAISSIVERKELFVTSKLWNNMHKYEDVKIALKETLRQLQLDYLDLYLIHYPQACANHGMTVWEPTNDDGTFIYSDVHYNETWEALEDLVDEGLVKSIGISNFNSKQIDDVLANCRIRPAVHQFEIHPYLAQKQLVEFCLAREIAVTAFSPLGSGDRPWAKAGEPVLLEDLILKSIAQKYRKSPAQILIRWAIERGLNVIPKSKTHSRIIENSRVFDFSLTSEDIETLYSLNRNWRSCCCTMIVNGVEVPEYHDHPLYPWNEPF